MLNVQGRDIDKRTINYRILYYNLAYVIKYIKDIININNIS
jgi:hypothetical protein